MRAARAKWSGGNALGLQCDSALEASVENRTANAKRYDGDGHGHEFRLLTGGD